MSNIEDNDIDAILPILNHDSKVGATIEEIEKALKKEEATFESQHPDSGWYNADGTLMSPKKYKETIAQDTGTPKSNKRKSKRPKQKILAVVMALITAFTMFIIKHNYKPEPAEAKKDIETSNINSQLRILSDFAIQNGILKQEEGLFKSPKLNIPIEDFIEFANIDSNDHIKIYLWNRLGVPVSDILKGISLRNTNMYFDSPEIENTYYASVINEFGETIKNETPLGVQYSKLMEDKLRKMPKDERNNLFTNLIMEYRLEQEANTKGGNYGR